MNLNKSSIIAFVLIIITCLFTQNSPAQEGSGKIFRAGATKSNITPFLGEQVIGNWNAPPANHIHDELHARCLVLDDSKTKIAFVIIDNCVINRELYDEAGKIIFKETGIPRENVLMSTVHTHSATSALGGGPSIIEWKGGQPFNDYQKFVIRRIADVVRIAINNLEPAVIGWGSGTVPEHIFIRRWKMKPGTPMPDPFGGEDKVVMNPGIGNSNLLEPAGTPDTEVSFLSVKSTGGKPIALLANYSLHYVGGVPPQHISADYFAVFADRIMELLKADRQDPPFIGIMSNGTSGDANNINFKGPAERNEPYEKMKLVAEDVAREVYRQHNKVIFHDWVPLKAASSDISLKVRKPDNKMMERAQYVIARPDTVKPVHRLEKTYAEFTVILKEWPENIDAMLQTFRIGDMGIAAIPFEVFAETGREIKAKCPFSPCFTIELANGWYGYLPTPEQHELGGYETWPGSNRVEKEASRKIVAKLLELFNKTNSL